MSSSKVRHTFYIEYGNVEYEVIGYATLIHDHNYGADADGNRGIPMDFLDDVEFELGEDAKKLSDEDQVEILKIAENVGNDHDWTEDYEEYRGYNGDDEY